MIMRYLQYLLRNITPLNIILAIVLVVLFNYMALPMFGAGIGLKLPEVKTTAVTQEEIRPQEQAPSISDYTVIAEQNLFNSGRTIPVLVKEAKPVIPKPEVILYGTLISGDLSLAYIEDKKSPQSTPGRGKRQTALRKGDTISGYILKDIEADKITMVRDDDTLIVYLKDPQKPKIREVTASTPQAAVPQQPVHTPPATQQKAAMQETVVPSEKEKQPVAQESQGSAKKTFLDFFKVGQ